MKTFALIAATGFLSAVFAQEVTETDTNARGVEYEQDQDVEVSREQDNSNQRSAENSHDDEKDFNKQRSYETDKEYKVGHQRLDQGEVRARFNKGKGRNFRKEGVRSYKEDCGADKIIEKSGDVKHYKNKEDRNECVVEVECEQFNKQGQDAKSKKNKWIKKRADRRGFNLNHGEDGGEKLVFKRNNNRSKFDADRDSVGVGQRFGGEHEKSFVRVNKRGREVDAEFKAADQVKVVKDDKVQVKNQEAEKDSNKQSFDVEKDRDVAVEDTNTRSIERDD